MSEDRKYFDTEEESKEKGMVINTDTEGSDEQEVYLDLGEEEETEDKKES